MGSIDYDYIFWNVESVVGVGVRGRGKGWSLGGRINVERDRRKEKVVLYMKK